MATNIRNRLRRAGLALVFGAGILGPATATSATIATDIVFVLDLSGSFMTRAPNFASGLADMAATFEGLGVDAQFGLVTFFDNNFLPRVTSDLTDAAGVAAALTNPNLLGDTASCVLNPCINLPMGGQEAENGLEAIAVALNGVANFQRASSFPPGSITFEPVHVEAFNVDDVRRVVDTTQVNIVESTGPQPDFISYRDDAIKNIVVLTDEPNQGNGATLLTTGEFQIDWSATHRLVEQQQALVNAIITVPDPGQPIFTTSTTPYAYLAVESGGNIFDVTALDSTGPTFDSFIENFTQTKFLELDQLCIADPDRPGCNVGDAVVAMPSPSSLSLLLIAFGMAFRRRSS